MKTLEKVNNSFELFELLNKHRIVAGEKPYRTHHDLVVKLERHVPTFCKSSERVIHKVRVNCLGKDVKDTGYTLFPEEVELMVSREFCPNKHQKIYAKIEHGALCAIEQLKDILLERQYPVSRPCGGKYYIDGYDALNNIAYEIDEGHHKYNFISDYEREKYIINTLGCTFIRIKV